MTFLYFFESDWKMKARTYGIEIEMASFERVGEFCTQNGGRLYVDCSHIEIDTPECLTPRQAALYDKAGERIVRSTASRGLYKNNSSKHRITKGEASYGRHDNFLSDEMLYGISDFNTLWLFLATRTMFDGSGSIDNEGKYRTSQRALFVVSRDGLSMYSGNLHTPIAIFKESDRLQICTGDSTMSEMQTTFNIAVTSMVLDFIEDDKTELTATADEIIRVFHKLPYSFENFGGFKIQTNQGRMSAIGVQRYFLEGAGQNGGDPAFLSQWSSYLDILEAGEYMELKRELDCFTKLWLLERMRSRHTRDFSDVRMKQADIIFHRLGKNINDMGLYEIARAEGQVDTLFDDEEIARAVVTPPHTRAAGRALANTLGLKIGFEPWDYVSHPEDASLCVNMPNPFKTYEEEVRKFARKHGLTRA